MKYTLEITVKVTVNGDEIERQELIEVDNPDFLAKPTCDIARSLITDICKELKEQYPT